jgi:drug/metabolite transporter (DMT)-like permease
LIGQLFALLVAACWSQNSIVYAYAGKRIGSSAVAHLRLWVALPVIILLHLGFTGELLPFGLARTSYIYLSISGIAGFCIADLCIFKAFVDIGHRETLVIMTTSPIFSAAGSWLILGEVLTGIQVIGIVLAVAGVGWVLFSESRVTSGSQSTSRRRIATGGLFALLGTFTQAGGLIIAKYGMGSDVHPVSANVLRISSGLAGLVIFAALRGQLTGDFKKIRDTRAMLLLSSGSLIGPVLGMILTLYAFTMAPVGVVTTLMQTSPIMLLPIDKFLFKKHVPIGAVFGTFAAVGGAALLFIG